MRFPHEEYSKMVASENESSIRQDAKQSAVDKKIVSESAIEDDLQEKESGEDFSQLKEEEAE